MNQPQSSFGALCWLLVGSLGCSGTPQPNVVVVTWDTTRVDYLDEVSAPHLMELAEDGVWFSEARTTVPLTTPAHASLLTGTYPPEHGVRVNGFHRLEASSVTLAEAFRGKGYSTGAFVSAAVLEERYGLSQGFDHYDDEMETDPTGWHFPERSGESTLSAAQQWVQEQEEPFFLWIHLFEPHRPWQPSKEAQAANPDPYRAEIWDTDRLTHAFLQNLDSQGLLSKTLLVLSSDHGEGLGEHGEWTHGSLIYDSTMRVPLVFWSGEETGISLVKGKSVSQPVSHVDLVPTLTDWFDLGLSGLSGVSLKGFLEGDSPPTARDILMESGEPAYLYQAAPLFGWLRDTMVWIDSPVPERFDIASDPGQKRDLFVQDLDQDELNRGRLKHPRAPHSILPSRELSDAETAQLEALGYVASAIEVLPKADIKERIPLMAMAQSGAAGFALEDILHHLDQWEASWGPLEGIQQLRTMVLDTQGRVEEADAYLLSVGAEDLVASRQKARVEALLLVSAIEAALGNDPSHPTAHSDLALTFWKLGRVEEARMNFEEALKREPQNPQVHLDAIGFYVGQQNPVRALEVLEALEGASGGLSGEWACKKARLMSLLERTEEQILLLQTCRDSGGELGPPEITLLEERGLSALQRVP